MRPLISESEIGPTLIIRNAIYLKPWETALQNRRPFLQRAVPCWSGSDRIVSFTNAADTAIGFSAPARCAARSAQDAYLAPSARRRSAIASTSIRMSGLVNECTVTNVCGGLCVPKNC